MPGVRGPVGGPVPAVPAAAGSTGARPASDFKAIFREAGTAASGSATARERAPGAARPPTAPTADHLSAAHRERTDAEPVAVPATAPPVVVPPRLGAPAGRGGAARLLATETAKPATLPATGDLLPLAGPTVAGPIAARQPGDALAMAKPAPPGYHRDPLPVSDRALAPAGAAQGIGKVAETRHATPFDRRDEAFPTVRPRPGETTGSRETPPVSHGVGTPPSGLTENATARAAGPRRLSAEADTTAPRHGGSDRAAEVDKLPPMPLDGVTHGKPEASGVPHPTPLVPPRPEALVVPPPVHRGEAAPPPAAPVPGSPAPEPLRPWLEPTRLEAWLDHPANGALQLSMTDSGSTLALTLTGLTLSMAELSSGGAENDLRNILHRALQGGFAKTGQNPGKGEGS
jgi:hypothetical protein